MKQRIKAIEDALKQLTDAEKAQVFPRFFKTGPGEYGEGDQFLGVGVPGVRSVARMSKDEPLEVVDSLLQSPIHECRLCGLLILVNKFTRAKKDEEKRREIYEFYLAHSPRINNWDLVDTTAPQIVGQYLLDKPRDILYRLIDNDLLWNKRIAVVSCLTFIRNNDHDDIIALTERLLATDPKPHDLMQKACGWMLREVGKHDGLDRLEAFLDAHAATMPRTMLRYAIEKMPPTQRQYYMIKKNDR